MIIEENGIRYQVIQGKATAIGFARDHKGTSINIPETVGNGYKVIAVGKTAFERNAKITSVFLPSSIHKIESNAFYSCVALQEVHMRKHPTEKQYCQIERYAFALCGELIIIDIPALLFVHKQACIHCHNLLHITGPIVALGASALSECRKIDRVFFANGAELLKGALEQSVIDHAVFMGDASIDVDVVDSFYNSNTIIHCNKDSNIADVVHYGVTYSHHPCGRIEVGASRSITVTH